MMYLWAIVLIVLNSAWLFLVVLGLPGNWLMVASTVLLAWWRHHDPTAGLPGFSTAVLIAIAALAVVGELAEWFAGVAGTQQAGGSRRSAVGALVGGLVGGVAGTFVIPFFGSVVGACVGAAIGAWGVELYGGRGHRASLRSGVGAGLGRLGGTLAKLGVGVAIWLIVAIAALWP